MRDKSYTDIKALSNSELGAYEQQLEGISTPFFARGAMGVGSEVHRQMLEPDLPEIRPFTPAELGKIDAMVKGLRNMPALERLLSKSKTEVRKVGAINIDGLLVPFRGIIDILSENVIVDLKTTSAKTVSAFLKSCDKFNYWSQMWIYMQLTGKGHALIVGVNMHGKTFMINTKNHEGEMEAGRQRVHDLTNIYLAEHGTGWIEDGQI